MGRTLLLQLREESAGCQWLKPLDELHCPCPMEYNSYKDLDSVSRVKDATGSYRGQSLSAVLPNTVVFFMHI